MYFWFGFVSRPRQIRGREKQNIDSGESPEASCMLLHRYSDERFGIHDLVREVAVSIASRDHHMFILRDAADLKEWATKEVIKDYHALILQYPESVSNLPDEIEGSNLSIFCMVSNRPDEIGGSSVGPVKIPDKFFQGLKVLNFIEMHFSSLPVSITLLSSLRTLCIERCAVEDISLIGMLKTLEILSLAHSSIEALPKELAHLTELRLLDLSSCTKLQLIPPNVLSSLSKLEELYMDCFIQWEVGNARRNASPDELKHLSHLTTLHVHIPSAQTIPKDLFDGMSKLDRYSILIGVEWDPFMYRFIKYEYSRTLRFNLSASNYRDHGVKRLLKETEDLFLDQLEGISNVLAELGDGEKFAHLKKLHIQNGSGVQYIATEKTEFAQLQRMTLQSLPQLVSFCSEDRMFTTSHQEEEATSFIPLPLFNKQLAFPHLKGLELSSINAKRIWHSQVSEKCFCAPNLTGLRIENCGNLEHLFSPSIARSLVQLSSINIVKCDGLKEIISTEELEEETDMILCFPKLLFLKIKDLHNLINFCSGEYNIEYPSLKSLEIEGCPELRGFINEPKVEENGLLGRQALFNGKVAVPSLQRLTISGLRNVKMIFDNQLQPGSFCKLREMSLANCYDELTTIFSSNVSGVFRSLETIQVHFCGSLELIFEVRNEDLDTQGILTFQNLRKVDIFWCENLKTLFPVSIAKDLPKLEELKLVNCGVEEIVSAPEGFEEPTEFKFPQVSSLQLTFLSKVRRFYRGPHTIVWPMLKKLDTDFPFFLKIVASQHLGIQETTQEQPLLLVEKVIPRLEELRLSFPYTVEIPMSFDVQFPANYFGRIKILETFVSSAGFPIHFLQSFYNLESLELNYYNYFNHLVPSEGDDAEISDAALTLSRIRKLKLKDFRNCEHICRRLYSDLREILEKLEILEVQGCDFSTIFGPSLASFQNLTTLKLDGCTKLIKLVTPSVVQNLVQLTTMTISHCITVTEIVANDEGDAAATCEISFSKLKFLELDYLSKLASFYPGNYSFEFPSLEELIVRKCPSLKIFCQGVLSTPCLHRVKESHDDQEGRWGGDLNTTIQLLYTEKGGYRGTLYELKLSDTLPDLMDIWNGRNPQENLNFKDIRDMEVCNCSSLKYIFTQSIALSLKSLEILKVKYCGRLEQILMEQRDEEELPTDHFIFRWLNSIEIESCSNLTSFYVGSQALELPWLQTIKVTNCPKMIAFASPFSRDGRNETSTADGIENWLDLGHLNAATFFSHKVACPRLSSLDLSSVNIQKLWDDELLPSSSLHVENLNYCRVNRCHSLKYLFPSFMIKHFVQLVTLEISDCNTMEEVIVMQHLTEEERRSYMLFPYLQCLVLQDLPRLARFGSENYFEFPWLRLLYLEGCPLLEAFISESVNVGDEHQNAVGNEMAIFNEKAVFPSLEYLAIRYMRNCRKIWHDDQFPVNSFRNLKHIYVGSCEILSSIFPFHMMERLETLDQLFILDCNSLVQIFDSQAALVANESDAAVTEVTQFVFPRLTYFQLNKLPSLKSFGSRIHATEWPSLRKLEVLDCSNVQIFAPEFLGFGETNEESQDEISNRRPLFGINEVAFPVLEELTVKQNDMWHEQVLSSECFRKLKVLDLTFVPENSTALPCHPIQSLPNLEKLVLKDASFCQVFQFEGLGDEEIQAALTQLSELSLSKLPELTHIWKEEEFQPRAALYNLKILEVLDCGKLKTLVPSLDVSFNHLSTLEVAGCHGLVCLIPCTTAKSLMQLERMSITDCEKIKEIVASDADDMEGAIVFSKLKYLKLSCLPNLASFCLAEDQSFVFPTLSKVIVRECPKIEIFCEGDLSTPKLQQVQLTGDDEDEGRWEGDLKTTMRKLFEEMVCVNLINFPL